MSTQISEAQEQANNKIFRRYVARGGIILPDCPARQVPIHDAHNLRAKIRDVMTAISKRSDHESRELNDEEMIVFSESANFIAGLSSSIDLDAGARATFGANSKTGSWVDADTGRPLTVLASTDKLADSSNSRDDGRHGGISFGDIVRGLAGIKSSPDIRNSLSEGVDSAGGFTVPSVLLSELIDRLRAQQVCIKAGARTLMLSSMKTSIARLDGDPTATWRSENAAIATSDGVFSSIILQPRSLGVIVVLSMELLEDSVNLSEGLARAFAGSFAVELDRVALFGSGTAPEPKGVFNTAGIGSISMGANGALLTNFDPFVDGWQSLADANSPEPSAAVLAPRTASRLAKLKDGQLQPLRKPALLETLPMLTSTSVPVTQVQGSSSVASSIILGDFSQMLFGVRADLRIQLLRELYMATGQFGFLAHLRADIAIEHPAAFCKIVGVL